MVSVGVEDVIVGVSCWCSRKEQTKYFGLWLLFLCSTLVRLVCVNAFSKKSGHFNRVRCLSLLFTERSSFSS